MKNNKKAKAKTIKVVSASGNTYYRPVKSSDSKPAKKRLTTRVAKNLTPKKNSKVYKKPITDNFLSMSERFNWKKFNKQYTDLYNDIQKDEKALAKKKAVLKMIGEHLQMIEREFSPM